MGHVSKTDLYRWCKVPASKLLNHPDLRAKFRIVRDSSEMGQLMAEELVGVIEDNNQQGLSTRAIIPCGPSCWYAPYTKLVNTRNVSLRNLSVFHMDECLDWQGRPLPANHPYNFCTFMEKHFYGGIKTELQVPEAQKFWLLPSAVDHVRESIDAAPIDITVGGWGQDGHIALS